MATDRWGIDEGYSDWAGRWQAAPPDTLAALHAAMGAPVPPEVATWTVPVGSPAAIHEVAELVTEDGQRREVHGDLPADLPLGYHLLTFGDGHQVRLVVTPPRCPAPPWGWGLAVQLYAARSRRSWGIGDLADLATLGTFAAEHGARCLLVNPLGSTGTLTPQQPSPYFADSRLFRSVLYLRVEDVPGAAQLVGDLAPLAAAGHDLQADRRIDRDRVLQLKLAALERLFVRADADPDHRQALEGWRVRGGRALEAFAVHGALSEVHGPNWQTWPAALRHPAGHAVARAGIELADRARFHVWCQWLLDQQLEAAAAAGPGLVLDLPVGFSPDGFDAWWFQDQLALGCKVGAPPDEFNTAGQDWGLPPFVPSQLVGAGFEPLVATFRATLRHARGLRIDHVMGLFRLFWIPDGADPSDGTYVQYDGTTLLDLLTLEAHRAGCFVVGEDLGTVQDEVRAALAARRVLSTRLVWFEDRAPVDYPVDAVASVTTHDLPTVVGLWTGADQRAQRAAGVPLNEAGDAEVLGRLQRLADAPASADAATVDRAVHRALGGAASALVLATLDDVAGVPERPNQPGTVDEAPNWRVALPLPLEDLVEDRAALGVVEAVVRGREDAPGHP